MNDLFGNPQSDQPIYVHVKGKKKPKVNPLIKYYGKGPEGAKCLGCKHQFFRRLSKTYSKCDLRKFTFTKLSDHSSRYQACGKFEPKP